MPYPYPPSPRPISNVPYTPRRGEHVGWYWTMMLDAGAWLIDHAVRHMATPPDHEAHVDADFDAMILREAARILARRGMGALPDGPEND